MATTFSRQFRLRSVHRLDMLLRNLSSASKTDLGDVPHGAVGRLRQNHPDLTPSDALCIVLGEALDRLQEQDPLQADLVYGRFWQGLSVAQMLADQRPEPQSERRFFQQQKQAIARLAEILVAIEEQHQQALVSEFPLRVLPMPTYERLLGVDGVIDRIRTLLTMPDRHFIVAIKGIGGIGKTAVANAVVRTIDIGAVAPGGLVWVSVRQKVLPSANAVTQVSPVFVDDLLDQVATQLNLSHLKMRPTPEKLEHLSTRLRKTPHLVVIDNLEEMADLRETVYVLERLAGPTKFLLTSRVALPVSAHFTVVELGELARDSAIDLVTHLAAVKGVDLAAPEAVYRATGGNPLAIVLTVSQMTLLPPSQVLKGIQSGVIPKMFDHIYQSAWSLLSSADLDLLFTLLRVGESADLDWLTLLYLGAEERLFGSLDTLTNLSLLQVQKISEDRRRYALHRVTTTVLGAGILNGKNLEWRRLLYSGYQRDAQRLLTHIRGGNLDPSTIELSLGLLRSYLDLARSISGEQQLDDTFLELALKIAAHVSNAGLWTDLRLLWPGLRSIALNAHQEYTYVQLTWQLAIVVERQGDSLSAIQLYEAVAQSVIFDALTSFQRAVFLLNMGTTYLWHGYYPQAEETLKQGIRDIRQAPELVESILVDKSGVRLSGQPAPTWEVKAYLLNQLGNLMMFRGDMEGAERLYKTLLTILTQHDGEDNLACVAYQALGRFYLYCNEHTEAIEILNRGLSIRRRRSDQQGITAHLIYLAGAYLGLGNIGQARACLGEAIPICKQMGNVHDLALAYLYQGYACWLQDEVHHAADYWSQVLDYAARTYFHDLELDLLRIILDHPNVDALPSDLVLQIRQFTNNRTLTMTG